MLFGPREGGKRAWSELGAIYYYLVSERVAARLGRGCVLPVCVAVCAHRCIDSLSERALFERSNAPTYRYTYRTYTRSTFYLRLTPISIHLHLSRSEDGTEHRARARAVGVDEMVEPQLIRSGLALHRRSDALRHCPRLAYLMNRVARLEWQRRQAAREDCFAVDKVECAAQPAGA